ncbi:er to golgi transport-related protein [Phaffia rhodozyma]|uniref:Er to golgi transport-related protein n=1 Tax=Phaffia rhodozyma TaxID=264483 RepID=A0A0F7STD0_PHARH|nr:er to golgi transport-related protein [Phaffia rhodozyma]
MVSSKSLSIQNRQASAAALTTELNADERACFFADVDQVGEKIGFYFAVQSGGSFEIDFVVHDPDDKILLEGLAETQGDYILTANTVGEYSFCFENEASLTHKVIDFDIMVESEPRLALPGKQTAISDHTSSLEESIYKLNGLLSSVVRTQKYFHTRNNRNESTVRSTQSRIFWYSVIEAVAMCLMSFMQVYILKTFFSRTASRYRV